MWAALESLPGKTSTSCFFSPPVTLLTSTSGLPTSAVAATAGTMGLVVGGATGGQLLEEEQEEEAEEVGEEQPGETGSTLTMAGGVARQTGGVRTTVGGGTGSEDRDRK